MGTFINDKYILDVFALPQIAVSATKLELTTARISASILRSAIFDLEFGPLSIFRFYRIIHECENVNFAVAQILIDLEKN